MRKSSLSQLLVSYLEDLRVKRRSSSTLETHTRALTALVAWCQGRKVTHPDALAARLLEEHAAWAATTGGGICSQQQRIVAVRGFCRWLTREGHLAWDPASTLEVPKRPRRLPRRILSEREIARLVALPDVGTPAGLRDRAILEVLYSTGLRSQELLDLELRDVDAARGVVLVRQGKGGKDRVVPIGERALHWLERYLSQASPSPRLFPMKVKHLYRRVRRHLDALGIPRGVGGCHLLRHAMATAMMEHGADVVSVGEILGHARIDTTMLYTQVTIARLREVHAATHPAGRRIPTSA